LFLVLSIGANFAQNINWLQGYGTKQSSDRIVGVVGKKDGNTISLLEVYGQNISDTLTLGNSKYYSNSFIPIRSFLVEQDAAGNVVKSILAIEGTSVGFCQDDFGNLYILSDLIGSQNSKKIGGKLRYRNDGDIVIVKYDKKLQYTWAEQYGDSGNCGPNNIFYSAGQLFLTAAIKGTSVNIGGQVFSSPVSPLPVRVFAALDTSNGSLSWCKYASQLNYGVPQITIIHILKMDNGKIFLAGTNNGSDDLIIQKDTIFAYSSFVVRLNSVGVFEKMYCFKNRFSNNRTNKLAQANVISSCATDGKNIFISGFFKDTSYWGSETFIQYPGNVSAPFIASLSIGLQPGWFYTPSKVTNGTGAGSNWNSSYLNYNKGYLYCATYGDADFLIDSAYFRMPSGALWTTLVQKLDILGNSLWTVMDGRDAYPSAVTSASNGVHVAGSFLDSLNFKPYIIYTKGNYDAFITRISDNTITRGTVSKGPYCASDTFSIPYTKEGNFDSLNYFIAELSDENGNFDKTIRRLGAVRTNKDSVIRGVLPLFQVQSSPNYRIRIRSTRPAVQSFYKLDTLKLLIYSRDKAYAGKDTAICPGDSISLRTYGGTKWEWSPKVNMADSTQNSTKVWPKSTQKYRIVISDSSGCGQADTAYKTIILRYPQATLNATDTTVCKGDTLWLTSTFKGGDSTGYTWQWQSSETGAWITQSKGQNQQQTVFGYKYNQDTAIALRLLLSDGCLRPQDSTEIKVGPKSPLKLLLQNQDTLLCAGVPYSAKAKGQGGDAANYQFRWALMPSNTLLSGADSIRWSPTQISQLRITLADGCMEREDTQYVQINLRKPLQANSNLRDSTLCFGQHTSYTAQGTGGDTANYQFTWMLDGKQLDTGKVLVLNSKMHFDNLGGSKILQLILSDNCSIISDTVSAAIRGRPKLQAQMQFDSVFCFGTSKTLKAMGTGGKGNYRFTWYDPSGNQISTSDSIVLNHNDKSIVGAMRYLAILSDGCSAPQDSQIATLNFLSPLAVSISSLDSCLRSGSTLTSKATGGDGNYTYHWYQNQLLQGQSNTLNISLPVTETQYQLIAKDGCSNDSAVASKAVSPYPQIRTSSNKDSGCEKLRVQFTATRQNQTTNEYRYTVAGSRTNWSKDSSYAFTFVAGKYTPIVEVKTKLGCTDTLQFKSITVHPKPTAAYSYTPARPVPKKPEVQFLNRSIGGVKYQWNFGKFGSSSAFQPKVSMTDTGEQNVYLVAINAKGCTDTSRGTVKVYEDYSVLLPTAFTPGADNLNGQFTPEFMGVENYTLSIYNRWGQLLFTAENQGWDGTYNGKAVPEGMYVYTLKITTFTYDKVQEQGVVMVLKGQ
jgi:gliding motility-associated-like protein